MANANAATKPLRLLCFDGGTPSGAFSQLSILNSLLSQASTAGHGKSKANQEFYPHTHFDMIAGTGLGGLLALMFGALQMSTSEAEDRLETLCSGVFTSEHTVSRGNGTRGIFQRARNLLWQNDGFTVGGNTLVEQEPLFDLSLLKKEVQRIVNEAKIKVHGMESIDPTQPNTCLAFVCVRNTFNMANCEHLRTYTPKDRHPTDYSIVEAACATITTPGLFDARVQMPKGQTLVGAGVGTNNPTRELLQEAERVYGPDRQVGCLISIGSGVLSPLSIKRVSSEGIDGVMVRVAADCEGVARTLRDNLREVGIYFRFSVDRGMGETTMLGWQQDDGSMTHTDTYLGDKEQYLTLCAKRMKKLDISFRLRMLNQATAIGITPKSPPPNSPYFTPRDRLLRHMEDTLLRPTQPTLNRKRILVISGNEGSGKTQIVSHFSRLHREDFTHFIYVDASTEGHIRGDLQTAIRSLGPEYAQATWENTLYSLQLADGPFGKWCLIFDDVQVSLPPFIPNYTHTNGTIIVVSRDRAHAVLSPETHLIVEEMEDQEALDALFRAAHREPSLDDWVEGEELLSVIGKLPLVVAQAGSYVFRMSSSVEGRREHFGFRRYKELYLTGELRWDLLRESVSSSYEGYHNNFMRRLEVAP